MDDTLVSLLYRVRGEPLQLLTELVLIGLCVNWCASVLHSTRGTRPLRGVLVVLIVTTIVVRVFGWERLELLYQYVLVGLAFVALVVFQPELRRALIRVGDAPFYRRRGPQSQLVSALAKSAGYLSRNRYGALVAIQRNVDLTGWAENGTMINAEVSASLLNSIFFPNSPLHDLGVIIRGKKVVAANCQFPSPDSDEIDAALGSRHLAAVGMSYESDALVLVVSEETGVISLADNGKLTRYLTLDDLTQELTRRLDTKTSPESEPAAGHKRWWSMLWRRLRRVLVVAPLTLIIWYVVDQATLDDTSVEVELTLRHDDPKYIVDVLEPAANIVDLQEPRTLVFSAKFRGPARAIDQLRSEAPPGQPLPLIWALAPPYNQVGLFRMGGDELGEIIESLRDVHRRGLVVDQIALKEDLEFNVDPLVVLRVPVSVSDEPIPIEVERIDPQVVELRVRSRDVGALPPEPQRAIRAPLGEDRLRALGPAEAKTFTAVPLERQIGSVGVVRPIPDRVSVAVRVVAGQRRRVENVIVALFVAPEVSEHYRAEKVDPNEWRIEVEVQGKEALVQALTPADINAYVHVTSAGLPITGRLEPQLRTLEVIATLVPPRSGVSIGGEPRVVRVNLIPHSDAAP